MKRILLGLLVIGLAFGLSLGCKLPAGCDDTTDQTQADSLADPDTKAFTTELSNTVYSAGSATSGDDFYAAQNVQRATLTFKTDGTWEYKVEEYEMKWSQEQTTAEDLLDNDTTGDEGWQQIDGYRGTYSYDPVTKLLEIGLTNDVWDRSQDKFSTTAIWSNTNEPPDTTTIKSSRYLVPFSPTTANPEIDITQLGGTHTNYAGIGGIVDAELTNGVDLTPALVGATLTNMYWFLPGGSQVITTYNYDIDGTWTSPVFDTVVATYTISVSDSAIDGEVTVYDKVVNENAEPNASSTYTDGATDADYRLYVYTKSPDYTLAEDGSITMQNIVETYNYDNDWAFDTNDYKLASGATTAAGAGALNELLNTLDLGGLNIAIPTDADGNVNEIIMVGTSDYIIY